MDRTRPSCTRRLLALLFMAAFSSTPAASQTAQRTVYNPVSGRTEVERSAWQVPQRPNGRASRAPAQAAKPPVPQSPPKRRVEPIVASTPVVEERFENAYDEPVQFATHQASCGCGDTACVGCGDVVGPLMQPRRPYGGRFFTGVELTFVKPRYESNVAFTTTETNASGDDVISDTEFDYDLEVTPRVFVGWRRPQGVGFRATWWQFDNGASEAQTNPPANGLGLISHPAFGTVDLSSSVPTDVFNATSGLNAYAIDLEFLHEANHGCWEVGVGGGVRYAAAEQSYSAALRNSTNVLRGQIDYDQSIEGFGPTISLSAMRPVNRRASLFAKARGSVLFGDGDSRLSAGEDLDLTSAFTTVRTTSRDDVLSIGEIQFGARWQGVRLGRGGWRPYLTAALEGQVWNGAGTATSEDGTLGFFGFATTFGFDW